MTITDAINDWKRMQADEQVHIDSLTKSLAYTNDPHARASIMGQIENHRLEQARLEGLIQAQLGKDR
jgi:hypothetical protein